MTVPRGLTLFGAFLALALLPVLPAGAAQAAAPTATTGPVTSVGPTSATATGSVNPGGVATTWYVEYGTSTSYGSKTSSVSAGSGTSAVPVSGSISGLQPGTDYHYRVVATSSAGTARGSDGLFTTLAPPGVVTGAASSISATGATLNGSVDANGRPTTWYFEYGTSTSYGTKTAVKSASGANAAAVSAAIGGLQAGRTYHFRLVATSDGGSTTGSDATFRTSGPPSASTDAPSSITPTTAKLNGTVTPNGLSTTWYIEYGTTTSYGTKTSAKSAGSGSSGVKESVSVTHLKTATTYHYRIVASNSAGTTRGADRAFSTSLPPGVQTGAAQSVGVGTATLTGSVDPRGRSTTWWFEYGTTASYGSKTSTQSAGSSSGAKSISAAIKSLAASTVYHFRLVAKSDAGTSVASDGTFQTSGVTLTLPRRDLVYGGRITLSGMVPTHAAGEAVTVFSQPYGSASFQSIAVVLSGAGGSWAYLAKPRIGTSYRAVWQGGMSPAVAVGVHPAVAFTRLRSGHFTTRVTGGHGFAHRLVQLQRRSATGKWVTLKRVRLGTRSRAEFKAVLPRGRSVLRMAISVNQAGAGYLGGFSRTIAVTRR
jgi:hypothetical protein